MKHLGDLLEEPGAGDQVSFFGSLIPGRRPQSGLTSCAYTQTWINNSREPVLIKCVTDTRMGVVREEEVCGGAAWIRPWGDPGFLTSQLSHMVYTAIKSRMCNMSAQIYSMQFDPKIPLAAPVSRWPFQQTFLHSPQTRPYWLISNTSFNFNKIRKMNVLDYCL